MEVTLVANALENCTFDLNGFMLNLQTLYPAVQIEKGGEGPHSAPLSWEVRNDGKYVAGGRLGRGCTSIWWYFTGAEPCAQEAVAFRKCFPQNTEVILCDEDYSWETRVTPQTKPESILAFLKAL